MILVTSRSLDILVQLSVNQTDCMEMPPMDPAIANAVFSYYLGYKITPKNAIFFKEFVEKCSFMKEGSGDSKKWYLPLALKVVGSQLQLITSKKWEPKKSMEEFVEKLKGQSFESSRESKLPIFSILRLGYDTLCLEDQFIFLDLALLWTPRWKNWRFDLKHMWGWMCIMHRKTKEAMDKSVST